MTDSYHIPVLLNEAVDGLNINPSGVYVDVTFGGGGHSRAILDRLNSKGRLIVFDQDSDAWENRIDDERVSFVRHNFRFLYHFLNYLNKIPVDGILADLGVSSHHFDTAHRGFSFRFEGDLDMRMNQNQEQTASDILNKYDEEKLNQIFKIYGEISQSKRLANSIVKHRFEKPFVQTSDLQEIASKYAPKREENRFLSQVFQALRIEVNSELESLEQMLNSSKDVLNSGGRLVVISYHSLEDRMVKNFMRTGDVTLSQAPQDIYGNVDVPFKMINRKIIVPTDSEIEINSRARSAKLRIAEKN